MDISGIDNNGTASIREAASVSMLKKSLTGEQEAAMKLLQSLPAVQDPALGNNIDTYA
jgi:hypothetical protein